MAGVLFHPEDLQHVHSKTLTNYDLNQKLAYPVRLTGHLWPEGLPPLGGTKEFIVLDIHNTPWRFVCKLRRTANGGHPQPEVSGLGWRQFIKKKEVRVGDEFVFYLPPPAVVADPALYHEPPVFVISVKREIRLLGNPIMAHILL